MVGGGPSGLATAIRLKQLAAGEGHGGFRLRPREGLRDRRPHPLRRGHRPEGARRALSRLEGEGRAAQPAGDRGPLPLPLRNGLDAGSRTGSCPPASGTTATTCASLGNLCRWLGTQAEALGVEIYPGFAAAEVLFDERRHASWAWPPATWASARTARRPRATSPAWSCTRSTPSSPKAAAATSARRLQERFKLREGRDPAVYGIGLKELWEIEPAKHRPGLVIHGAGWPLDNATYGGSWVYHLEANQVSVGLVVGLGYTNPYLSPFEEFQRFKTHPAIRGFLEGGRRIVLRRARHQRRRPAGAAEARLSRRRAGGRRRGLPQRRARQGQPRRDQVRHARGRGRVRGARRRAASRDELAAYPRGFREELAARRAAPRAQLQAAACPGASSPARSSSASTRWSSAARRPGPCTTPARTTRRSAPKDECAPIAYPKPDGVLTFDRLSSVFVSNVAHEEDQPAHLTLKDAAVPIAVNLARLRRPGDALLPGRRLRDRHGGAESPLADQRPELRALQDLRHQGSDARTSTGSCPKAAAARTTRTCDGGNAGRTRTLSEEERDEERRANC